MPKVAKGKKSDRRDVRVPSVRKNGRAGADGAVQRQAVQIPWQPVQPQTLTDQAYAAIRERLAAEYFQPGEYLRERELCKVLNVSRTPIREAFGRLATEGFLERRPNHGFRVPLESPDRLLAVFPIVVALEVLAARLAFPKLRDGDFTLLRRINHDMARALKAGDARLLVDANERFHHELAVRAANPVLSKLLDDLRARVRRLDLWSAHDLTQSAAAIRQHDEIIAAAEQGDFNAALRILEANRMHTATHFASGVIARSEQRPGDPEDGNAS